MEKEEKEGKKFLLPVKLSECKIPKKIEDRLFADFSKSISLGTSILLKDLKKRELILEDPANMLIPLKFEGFLHLDKNSLIRRFEQIENLIKKINIVEKQLLIVYDNKYSTFISEAHIVYDNLKEKNAIRIVQEYKNYLRQIDDLEEIHKKGLLVILNQTNQFNFYNLIESCYWFSKSILYSIGSILDRFLEYEVQEYAKEKLCFSPFSSWDSIKQFYGIADIASLEIWKPSEPSNYIKFQVDANTSIVNDFKKFRSMKINPWDVYDPTAIFKYLVPQMVNVGLMNPKCPIWWEFQEALIGPA